MDDDDNTTWSCLLCTNAAIPFTGLFDETLKLTLQGKNIDPTYNNCELLEDSQHTKFLKEIEGIDIDNESNNSKNSCLYYSLSEFNNIKSKKKLISVFHLNTASLGLHFDELHTLLSNCDLKFDFIGISETGFKNYPTIFDLEGYNNTDCPTESSKGGVRLYISKKFNYKSRNDLQIYKSEKLESTFAEIITDKGKKNLIVGCIYKHPDMPVDEFNVHLSKTFEKLINENKKVIILGDFNIDLMKTDIHSESSDFLDLITSNSLIPLILRPTRITPHSKTLIDNIFTNFTDIPVTAGNLTFSISDHLAQFALLDFSIGNHKTPHTKYIRNYKHFDKNDFIMDILAVDWDDKIKNPDPNLKFSTLIDHVNHILDKHAPLKKITTNLEIAKKPWISRGILTSINKKNRLHKKFLSEKQQTKKNHLHCEFKIYRNNLTKLMRSSKDIFYRDYFSRYKSNIKMAWKGIKTLINCKKKESEIPSSIVSNDKTINDPLKIANVFNTHFSTIAEKTKKKIIPSKQSFSTFLGLPNEKSLFLRPTSADEIGRSISALKESKATGPGSIPTNIIKLISPTLSPLIAIIINSCLTSGSYPQCLKYANVIPIHKKDSILDPENYRPISLLSNINKIFENILHIRLSTFLDVNYCLYNAQFGFRKKHSTTHALIQLTESIRNAIDKGMYACGVFVDLQKAFDTVDHNILINKLSHYGVRGTVNSLFKSYLSNRFQSVTIHENKSETILIKHGVPQGSVLGPLLFLIYINDFHKTIKHSKVIHFADDTSLINCNKSLKKINKQVNEDLRLLCEWLRANKISLNTKKTEIIIFRSKKKEITKHLNFRASGQKIEPSKIVTYLGVVLDQSLAWNDHFNILLPKLSRATGMLAKIRHYVPYETLCSIYYAIFNSHLTYSSQIWGYVTQELNNKIKSLQNKALKIIHFKKQRDSAGPLYYKSKILRFNDHIKLKNCILAFDHQRKFLPSIFHDFCKPVSVTHNHKTKSELSKLTISRTNTVTYGSYSIRSQVANDWNENIPSFGPSIFSCSKSTLSKKLRDSFLASYEQ